ncbi:MAG: redoxin domain-containing protein [Bacteroidales bacterium]
MRKLLIGFIIILFYSGCAEKENSETSTGLTAHISGTLKNGIGSSILIQKISADNFQDIDSLVLDDKARFIVDIPVSYPGFFALRNENGDYITLLIHANDTIEVEADYYNFSRYKLKGTDELEAIARLNKKTQEFLEEISEYARIVTDSVNSENYSEIKAEIDVNYRKSFDELKDFSVNFIYENEGSLVTLLALTNQLGRNFFVFHPVKDFEIFQRVDSILIQKYPDLDAVKQIHTQVERIKLSQQEEKDFLGEGEKAPDFTLNDPSNKEISLSDLKGKIVFLNFWASWCQPCMEQLPSIKNIYNQYQQEGLEVMQVSLDKNYEDWSQIIEQEGLEWINVSELNFWDSKVASLYGVTTLPSNFLISKEGKIIAVNLSPEQLKKELKNIFN